MYKNGGVFRLISQLCCAFLFTNKVEKCTKQLKGIAKHVEMLIL